MRFNSGVDFTTQSVTITSSTYTIDWTKSSKWIIVLSAITVTLSFTAPVGSANLLLEIVQDTAGGRVIVWPTILWPGGTAPTLTSTANKRDIVAFWYNGTNYLGTFTANF